MKTKGMKFSGFNCKHCDTLWEGKGKKCPDCGRFMVKIEIDTPFYGENFFQQFLAITDKTKSKK